MKVGIITYWFSEENYGQLLQCYALQLYLRNRGYDAFLVLAREKGIVSRMKNGQSLLNKLNEAIKKPLFIIRELENKINRIRYSRNICPVSRGFSNFIKEHIVTTNQEYTIPELYENPPSADIFVCGSDQIWGGPCWFYYLDFVPEGIRKVSYAASFGGIKDFTDEYKYKLISLLQQFDFLSLREQSSVDLCHSLGLESAVRMPDPTLLLNKADYNLIREDCFINGKYVLLYLLGNMTDMKPKEVYDYARKKGLKVVYVASQGRYDKYEKTFPTIGQWVNLIAGAELVVTNSFHGTVFSAIYHKPFIVASLIGPHSRMNSRIDDFLNGYCLKDRIYTGSIDELANATIDFSDFELMRQHMEIDVEQKFIKMFDSI